MKPYCTQSDGRCWSCPLSRDGLDCLGRKGLYWTAEQAGEAWGLSHRQVLTYLNAGRIPNAERTVGRYIEWKIPVDTPPPDKHNLGRKRKKPE